MWREHAAAAEKPTELTAAVQCPRATHLFDQASRQER